MAEVDFKKRKQVNVFINDDNIDIISALIETLPDTVVVNVFSNTPKKCDKYKVENSINYHIDN